MLGHLGVNVPDLAAARAYYDPFVPLLGFEPWLAEGDQLAYRPAAGKPGTFLFFYPAPARVGYDRDRPGLQHLAFMVPTRSDASVQDRLLALRGRDPGWCPPTPA